MAAQGSDICGAVNIPVMGDGDTGFGNALNIKRTVRSYHQAGYACVMNEDQMMPKRCGHTAGKEVVMRDEALGKIQAAGTRSDLKKRILVQYAGGDGFRTAGRLQ